MKLSEFQAAMECIAPRELAATFENGWMRFEWNALANDCVLEYAPTLTNDWQAVAGPGLTNATTDVSGFYRLRR